MVVKDERRRMTWGDAMDRLLIGSVGIIVFFAGRELSKMTDAIHEIKTQVATLLANQDAARLTDVNHEGRIARLEDRIIKDGK